MVVQVGLVMGIIYKLDGGLVAQVAMELRTVGLLKFVRNVCVATESKWLSRVSLKARTP